MTRLQISALLALLALASAPRALAQSNSDLTPLLGRWQLNPAETHMGRFGPNGKNMVRSPTFSFIFTPAVESVNVNVYAQYPQSAPSRTMALIPDGKPHFCQAKSACQTAGGNPKDQSWIYHEFSPRFVMRVFYTKGKVTEYSTYAVSADGKTFTMIAWSPATPYWQNIQVFDKQP